MSLCKDAEIERLAALALAEREAAQLVAKRCDTEIIRLREQVKDIAAHCIVYKARVEHLEEALRRIIAEEESRYRGDAYSATTARAALEGVL